MSGRRACCAFLALLLTLDVLEASFKVSIHPRHVRIDKTLQSVTFTCNVDFPLTGCQFHFLSSLDENNTPLDCSAGNLTKNFGALVPKGVQDFYYTGSGLDKGQCGITLQVQHFKQWVVGCRVKAAQGSWKYDFADLFARTDFLEITASPETPIVLPGHDLNVMCSNKDGALYSCAFSIKGLHKELNFNSGMKSPDSRNPHYYQGKGLDNGQCGIKLHNVGERHNGPGFCRLNDDDDAQGVGFFSVVVAAPPGKPVLEVVSLADGRINATCSVNGGRPAPNIIWLLGGKTLRPDGIDFTAVSLKDGWMWPWNVTSITQNLVYELKPDDEGKVLTCIASHMALGQPLDAHKLVASKTSIKARVLNETDDEKTTITPTNNAKGCHRLTSLTVDISCVYKSTPVPCNTKAMITTEALATCKEGFSSINNETERSMTCQADGKWSAKLLICNDGCGERSKIRQNINVGVAVEPMDIPWQVAIYYKIDDRWKHICGGTLIHMKYVLSAAHCFWDNSLNQMKNETLYMVTAGKTFSDFHKEEPFSQRTKVAKIHIPELYHGRDTNFHNDIALLKLRHRMKLDAYVKVVCISPNKELKEELLSPGQKGTVAGWGVTNDGYPSSRLLSMNLPYVSYNKCVNELPQHMRRWLTYDKFCGGYRYTNKSVCSGDSGGGLVFQHAKTEKFYLLGVVSNNFKPGDHVSDGCYTQHYTAFTDAFRYYDWFIAHIFEQDK